MGETEDEVVAAVEEKKNTTASVLVRRSWRGRIGLARQA
jgi:hypothetical protein